MKVSIVFLLIIVDMFVLCNLFKLYVQCAATFWSVHLKEMAEVTQFSPSTEVGGVLDRRRGREVRRSVTLPSPNIF